MERRSADARNTNKMASLALTWFTEMPVAATGTVVTTGIFDLLHVGHVRFLAAARAGGARLAVGIEDDARVRARKGPARPIVPALERCEIIAAQRAVDAVFLISGPADLWQPEAYVELLTPLRPSVLAVTAGDPSALGKRRAANLLGADVLVVPYLETRSTTAIAEHIALSISAVSPSLTPPP